MIDHFAIPDFLIRARGKRSSPRKAATAGYVLPPTPKAWSKWPDHFANASVYFFLVPPSAPVSGWRHVRAAIGRKWVRCCTDVADSRGRDRWRMSRADWDRLGLTPVEGDK